MGIVFGLLVVGVVVVLLIITLKKDDLAKHINELNKLRVVLSAKFSLFFELADNYHIDEKVKYLFEKEKELLGSFNREIAKKTVNKKIIQDTINKFKNLIDEMDDLLSSPDEYLLKKFYDPFSGEVTEEDSVDLVIEHPKFGVVSILVNKKTKKQYNDPKHGPKSFNFNNFNSRPNQSYLIQGGLLEGYGVDYCNGFIIFDSILFYNTFCHNVGGDVYFDDMSLYNENDQTNNGNVDEYVSEGESLISEVRGGVQACEIAEGENVSGEDIVGDSYETIPERSQQVEASDAQHVEPASESNASYSGTLD